MYPTPSPVARGCTMAEAITDSYASLIVAGVTRLDACNSAVNNSFFALERRIYFFWIEKKAFRKLAHERSVLGFPEALEWKQYFESPIIHGLQKCYGTGFVYVAYVPSGKGKTTACKVFLKEARGHRRGIAICPSQTTMPYAMVMLQILGLNVKNPLCGWMTCLKDALLLSEGRQAFSLLDDFMSGGPNDFDERFLCSIKAHFRDMKVTVVVLTRSYESAEKMLSLNNKILKVTVVVLTRSYESAKKMLSLNNKIWPLPECYTESTHAWSKMSWSASLLRKVALANPKYKDIDKDVLEGWSDWRIHRVHGTHQPCR
jgi:hypothetical protein